MNVEDDEEEWVARLIRRKRIKKEVEKKRWVERRGKEGK